MKEHKAYKTTIETGRSDGKASSVYEHWKRKEEMKELVIEQVGG